MRDGTRLAVEIYRPTDRGVVASVPLPVILHATPYHRASDDPKTLSLSSGASLANELLRHGYVIVSADIRGRGASFGQGVMTNFGDTERNDMYDLVEWGGHQPWSSGKVGTMGCSYPGLTQLWAASAAPPSMKTMAASSFVIDSFPAFMVNGATQTAFFDVVEKTMYRLDVTNAGPRVDTDTDGKLLQAATEDHKRGWAAGTPSMQKVREAAPFRLDPVTDPKLARPLADHYTMIPNMRMAGISELQFSGWRDIATDQAFAFYGTAASAGIRQKMIIGPWKHCEWYSSDKYNLSAEHLRWFDYWLKGTQNGAMDGPPIRYYVGGSPAGQEWRTADRWPIPDVTPTSFALWSDAAGDAGGALLPAASASARRGRYTYTANYEASTRAIRGRFNLFSDPAHPLTDDTATLDANAVLFATEPFATDTEIIGYPLLNLWISSTAKDQDFFFYLESVDPSGKAELIGDGAIRASNRATRQAPYETFGLPWHSSMRADQKPLVPGKVEKLEVALYPMAQRIRAGYRLRLAITNSDKGNFDTPVVTPAPKVTIYFDKDHPSALTLPIKQASQSASR
ncbi:CocE/NonD family hydrolase [Rhizorhabdus argentea]|uniref:CocE/NonD family hydrolase n=1 Tax=Rhizorhabdus argentea TaxID=1387174 RepID=UPI0030ED0017